MTRRLRWPRLLRFFIGFKLTPVGRVAVMAIFLSAIGSVTLEIPIYLIFCGMIAAFGVIEVTGLLMRPRLRVHAWVPEQVGTGETAVGYVTVENRGWLPACDIMCSLFDLPAGLRHLDGANVIPVIRRGEQARIPVSIAAQRRGEYTVPEIRVHSTFPFNLMRFGGARVPPGKLTVLPAFHVLEEFSVPVSQRYQPGGLLVESRSGDSPEYVGNREYVSGEPARRLDFRAWARVGKPVVREFQDEFCSRVALVLDTHHPPIRERARRRVRRWFSREKWIRNWSWNRVDREAVPTGGNGEFEAAVSLTASVANALHETEAQIDLFAAGPDLFLFQTATGVTHFESVLEILAAVGTTRRNPFETISPVIVENLESISVAICVVLDWDESREELARRILEAGCALRVLLVRDDPPTRPFREDESYQRISPEAVLSGALRRL
jgi:uncharacterized protein (DUF58 family)